MLIEWINTIVFNLIIPNSLWSSCVHYSTDDHSSCLRPGLHDRGAGARHQGVQGEGEQGHSGASGDITDVNFRYTLYLEIMLEIYVAFNVK